MPVKESTYKNMEPAEAHLENWVPLIIPALNTQWADYLFSLPANRPAPTFDHWLAVLHTAATTPDEIPQHLLRLLNVPKDGHNPQLDWGRLTDLLKLTFAAAKAEAQKLDATNWQSLIEIQNRILQAAARISSEDQAAVALERTRLQNVQQRYAREQALIYKTIVTLGTRLDTSAILKLMSRRMVETMEAGASVICQIDKKARPLRPWPNMYYVIQVILPKPGES